MTKEKSFKTREYEYISLDPLPNSSIARLVDKRKKGANKSPLSRFFSRYLFKRCSIKV
jgi:hypothetical protein